MRPKLTIIFPISGPINGVKSLTKELLKIMNQDYVLNVIDTGQAKEFNEFGKLSLNKLKEFLKLLLNVLIVNFKSNVYLNLSVNGYSFYRDFIFLVILVLKKCNITIHVHANGLESKTNFFIKYFINKCKIIVINNNQLIVLNKFNNVYLIPNSINDFYKKKPVKNKNKKLEILYFSNISKLKGVELLELFCDKLLNLENEVHITICGGILDEFSQQILDKISNFKHVTFKGAITNDDEKMQHFLKSDLFIFTSNNYYEVYPLVYLEALMNKCVILTTKQYISDYVISNNNGLYLDNNFNLDIIKPLFKRDDLEKMQSNSRELFLKISNFNNFYLQIKNIINA